MKLKQMPDIAQIVFDLQAKIGICQPVFDAPKHPNISTSFQVLDDHLPASGMPLGSIVELLCKTEGQGAYELALKMSHEAVLRKNAWAVVDTENAFNPAAAAAHGMDLKNLIIVRPQHKNAAWAFTQLLRSPEIGAAFWETRSTDNLAFRRFQLAAERSGSLGFVIRPMEMRRKPCWSSLRMAVARNFEKFSIGLLHVRGGKMESEGCIEVAL